VGEKMILEGNAFVEGVLPGAIPRKLTDQEMSVYRAPSPTPESRRPTWRFPNELPIAGEPTASVLRNTVGYMLKNIDNQATNGEEKSKPEAIKLGLDLHARQVTECRQLDGSTPKPAQKWGPWKLLDKVEEWVKAEIKVYSCYEAGPVWVHIGVHYSIVVVLGVLSERLGNENPCIVDQQINTAKMLEG
jgi:hypothetical protein